MKLGDLVDVLHKATNEGATEDTEIMVNLTSEENPTVTMSTDADDVHLQDGILYIVVTDEVYPEDIG